MQLQQATDPDYWQTLLPAMSFSVEGRVTNTPELTFELNHNTHDQLVEEGYLQFNGTVSADLTQKLRNTVAKLLQSGWHPLFAFIYDDLWELAFSLNPLLGLALGNAPLMLPDFWIWNVPKRKRRGGGLIEIRDWSRSGLMVHRRVRRSGSH